MNETKMQVYGWEEFEKSYKSKAGGLREILDGFGSIYVESNEKRVMEVLLSYQLDKKISQSGGKDVFEIKADFEKELPWKCCLIPKNVPGRAEGGKYFMTWQQVYSAAKSIADFIDSNDLYSEIDNVFGIPRGGVIVAEMLSSILKKPAIYDEKIIRKGTLVVDDIADSGKTLKKYAENMTATIAYKKKSCIEPDMWVCDASEFWVVFPWETEETSKYDNI